MMTKKTVGTILGLLLFAVAVSGTAVAGQESPLRFTPPAAAARIPVEFWENLAFVRCRVNGSEPAWFVFDTGASVNVLDLDFAAKLNLDLSDKQKHPRTGQEIIKVHGLKFSLPGVELTGQSATVMSLTDLALFAGHPMAGVFGYEWLRRAAAEIDYTGRLEAVTIGKWTFKNVPAVFPAAGAAEPPDYLTKAVASTGIGLIGSPLLSRFTLVFDYPAQTLWMEPNPGWDKPIEWDRSGAVVMSAELTFQSFRILGVIKGSPAAEAGLAAGDVITAVNGRPAGEFTLPQFREMLKRDGDRIILEVKRGEETRKVTLQLRKLV